MTSSGFTSTGFSMGGFEPSNTTETAQTGSGWDPTSDNGFDFTKNREREIAEYRAKELAARPPKKRLIVCCDGTWQSSNHGIQSTPSNIAKISRAIAKYTREADGTVIHQIVWYDAGVGTGTDSVDSKASAFAKSHQGAYGEGLDENVCEAYNFIVNNYNPGDELYFFGFSRGAYTARAASGLVARIGICPNAVMDDFFKMYNAYKGKKADQSIRDTAWAKTQEGMDWLNWCDHDFTIKCVGVFDTVGALGWPNNTHFDTTEANAPHAFHNTDVHPEIENAFQALAIDEHRAAFPPTMWSLPKDGGKTNLIQCWFPGYHINVGGGSSDFLEDTANRKGDFESMANMTFAWMVDRVQQYTPLAFDSTAIFTIIQRYADNITELIRTQNPDKGRNQTQVYRGWGIGPDVDSMDWKMAIAGSVPRTPAEYNKDASKITHEYIHPVVAHAWGGKWQPPSMAGFRREQGPDKKGHVWRKEYTPPSGQGIVGKVWSYLGGKSVPAKDKIHLEIPEWVIPPDRITDGVYECDWGFSTERGLIRADTKRYWDDESNGRAQRKKVVEDTIKFIKQMDRDNGYTEMPIEMYDPSIFAGKGFDSNQGF